MVMEMVEETIVAPTKDLWRVDLETLKELAVKVALTRWIEKMESVIDNSGCLANQRVKGRDGANAMAWDDFKALLTTEFSLSNEIEKLEGEFWNHSMVGADHAGYTDQFHKLTKLVPNLVTLEAKPVILTVGILTDEAVRKGTLAKAGKKRKERDEATRGRAFNVNDINALQDPNLVTGMYSLNNIYATVLFDSGADFSFISTKFAPLLNEKPSIANRGYVIEVANGKKEDVDPNP
ncbi:reverse transcriptase domain-containing protein [Tanacetum coccineum]